jgi:lipoprotein-anchoring transpeptidase ErfK/SrfK
MRLNGLKLIATLAALAALPACVPDPALVASGAVKAPEPKLVPNAYVAKTDGAFTIPAIPTDKVPTQYQRQEVYFPSEDAVGTIIINPAQRTLHLVTGKNKALRYGIAVGKSGFEWSGEALITEAKHWPTWTPPKEMIERKPSLAQWEKGQPGGLTNPLGARALYLTTNGVDYGYRIHGTPEWNSIGSNASSGCIRMINQDVIDLFERAQIGAKVVVLNRDGSRPTKLTLPPPAPKKPKPAEVKPAVVEPALPELPAPPPLDPALMAVSAPVMPAQPDEPATDN